MRVVIVLDDLCNWRFAVQENSCPFPGKLLYAFLSLQLFNI
jgi:hypothetical protein